MLETIKSSEQLNEFQNIMLIYKDGEGRRFVGNANFYNGKTDDSQYMAVLYKDEVPKTMSLLDGWNYLEDNSPNVRLAEEPSMQVAIEDFLFAHGLDRDFKTVTYHVIDNYMQLSEYVLNNEIACNEVLAFGILKEN